MTEAQLRLIEAIELFDSNDAAQWWFDYGWRWGDSPLNHEIDHAVRQVEGVCVETAAAFAAEVAAGAWERKHTVCEDWREPVLELWQAAWEVLAEAVDPLWLTTRYYHLRPPGAEVINAR